MFTSTVGTITLILSIGFLGLAIYQLVNIFSGTAVDADVVGYDESDYVDPETGVNTTNLFPTYRYTYQGVTKIYQSKFAIGFTWLKKSTNRIYISKSGKVFEKEGVIAALIIAVICFLIV